MNQPNQPTTTPHHTTTLPLTLLLLLLHTACTKPDNPQPNNTTTNTNQTNTTNTNTNTQTNNNNAPPPIAVETTTIQRGPIERLILASRPLEAEQTVQILARTSNRVQQIHTEEGDHVQQNQLLATLENDIQTITRDKAQNQLAKLRQEHQRQQNLHQQNLISDQIFNDITYDLKLLQLNLQEAQRQVDYTQIRATITGTITQRHIKLGQEIRVGQPLFDIINFDTTIAHLYIPEKEIAAITPNQETRVTAPAFPNQTFKAHVLRIAPIVQANSGMIKVTIAFHQIGPLRPGMYIDAGIVVETKPDAILIPKQAITYDGDQQYIYRLTPDRTAQRIRLEPGLQDPHHIESLAHIQPGDQIITAGQTALKDGSPVRLPTDPEPEEPEKTEPTKKSWLNRLFTRDKTDKTQKPKTPQQTTQTNQTTTTPDTQTTQTNQTQPQPNQPNQPNQPDNPDKTPTQPQQTTPQNQTTPNNQPPPQ